MKKYSLLLCTNLFVFGLNAQIKNQETKTFNIKGNCTLAKNMIEKAGNQKKIAAVDYDTKSHVATISYDKNKTSASEVLKKVAFAGFDNDEYMAPDEAYANLPKDCQYKRDKEMPTMNDAGMNHESMATTETDQKQNELSPVFDAYFNLKDAFISGNSAKVTSQITAFQKSVSAVDMGKIEHQAHMVWMDVLGSIESTSKKIAQEKDIDKQRKLFASLSDSMYKLAKVSKLSYVVYYQHCPMFNGGANWLSKDDAIKNPFYGNQMLTCGSTVEKLKN